MTGETNLRTEMRGPDPAELAAMTDRRRVDGDPLATSRPGHDHTCCFVAEDEWVVDARVADGPVQVPMTVGATQTHGSKPDERGGICRNRLRLLAQPEVTFSVKS
jgi:hypothetical protein